MAHAFISYAREDRDKVAGIAAALEQCGVDIWMDDRLPIGSQYDSAIESALDSAAKVIVAWSPAAVDSRWVRAEAGEGLERGILVPVMVEQARIPLEFRRTQTLDFTSWDGSIDAAEFAALVAALGPKDLAAGDPQPTSRPAAVAGAARIEASKADEPITGEVVSASKYFGGNFRLHLRIGGDRFSIRLQDFMIYQRLLVNGREVASSWGLYPDHFRFTLETGDDPVQVDVVLSADLFTLNRIMLSVDGREVLRYTLSWGDGLVSAMATMLVLIALTGPLIWWVFALIGL